MGDVEGPIIRQPSPSSTFFDAAVAGLARARLVAFESALYFARSSRRSISCSTPGSSHSISTSSALCAAMSSRAPASPDRMAALPCVRGRDEISSGLEFARDRGYRRAFDQRHIGKRNDPALRAARCSDAMRKAHAHAARRVAAHSHVAAFLFEHIGKREISGLYHRNHIEPGRDQITRRVRADRYPIGQWMQQLVAAETRTRAGREQNCADIQ